jgi:hypothetical protein
MRSGFVEGMAAFGPETDVSSVRPFFAFAPTADLEFTVIDVWAVGPLRPVSGKLTGE